MIGTIQAHGKTYEVIKAETVSAVRNQGRGNTASAMQKAGVEQTFIAKLIGGKAYYEIHQYAGGNFGKPVKVA